MIAAGVAEMHVELDWLLTVAGDVTVDFVSKHFACYTILGYPRI